MSKVLLLTSTGESAAEILPSLSLLDHTVRLAAASADSVPAAPGARLADPARDDGGPPDAVLVDARRDLVRVRELLQQLSVMDVPLVAVISEGAWAAVTTEWGVDEVILHSAGPGEVEARIRLAIGRAGGLAPAPARPEEVRSGELVIDEATYSAKIRGVALDLTFKEFELLKFLAQHPRRVFTRSQLLQEVWGYDYFGGTRTVDVHVRRLRAKLGTENEELIGTVRNVGYKFVPARPEGRRGGKGADGGAGNGTSANHEPGGGSDAAADADADADADAGHDARPGAASGSRASIGAGSGGVIARRPAPSGDGAGK